MIVKRGGHRHLNTTINGTRYREALNTTDIREARRLAKLRVADIHNGKGSSTAGRKFGRLPFEQAAEQFIEERKPQVSERTIRLERERLKPLKGFFSGRSLLRLRAEDVAAYQKLRREKVSGRTINMEVGVLRRMMKRAKAWSLIAEDVKMDPSEGSRSRKCSRRRKSGCCSIPQLPTTPGA
jgi:hypothetical protein